MNIKQELWGNDLGCEEDKCGGVVDLTREFFYEEMEGKGQLLWRSDIWGDTWMVRRSQLHEILCWAPQVKKAIINKGPRQQYPGVRTQSIWEPMEGVPRPHQLQRQAFYTVVHGKEFGVYSLMGSCWRVFSRGITCFYQSSRPLAQFSQQSPLPKASLKWLIPEPQ